MPFILRTTLDLLAKMRQGEESTLLEARKLLTTSIESLKGRFHELTAADEAAGVLGRINTLAEFQAVCERR